MRELKKRLRMSSAEIVEAMRAEAAGEEADDGDAPSKLTLESLQAFLLKHSVTYTDGGLVFLLQAAGTSVRRAPAFFFP